MKQDLLQEQGLSQLQIKTLSFLTMSQDELKDFLEKESAENPFLNLKSKKESLSSYNSAERSERYNEFYENLSDNRSSLSSVLEEQIRAMNLSEIEVQIGLRIIQSLDGNGFLTMDANDLLEDINNQDKITIYHKMCDTISTLVPEGCATSDVYTSLKCQYRLKYGLEGDENMLCFSLINKDDFTHYSRNNFNYLKKNYGITPEIAKKCFDKIATLNPYPGSIYNVGWDKIDRYDIILQDGEEGELEIKIAEESIPNVEIIDAEIPENDAKYNKKSVTFYKSQAQSLLALLDMRTQTIAKITQYIVFCQKDYIKDNSHPKTPLSLKDISSACDVSISTVSRIINCHNVNYNGKNFSLRTLLEQSSVENQGQSLVENKISEIISSSAARLSDEKIKKILQQKYGIQIARRTVQKYRSRMNIASSYSKVK